VEPDQVLRNRESLQYFSELPVRSRNFLTRLFDQLAAAPEQGANPEISGPHQIPFRLKRFDRWELTYRVDSPVKQIQIIGIQKLPAGS